MNLLGLRSLIYPTNDMKADAAWWAKATGMKPNFESAEYTGFNLGNHELGLFAAGKMSEGGISYIGVEDVQVTYDEFLAAGCVKHEAPADVVGGLIMASVKRPNGTIIGLIFNPHFKN